MGLTTFLNDLIEICTFLTEMFISLMSIFMEPPLSIFIGCLLFLIILDVIIRHIKGIKQDKTLSLYVGQTDKRIKGEWEKTKILKSKEQYPTINKDKFARIEKETEDLYQFKRDIDKGKYS